jgi:hypothetical protein
MCLYKGEEMMGEGRAKGKRMKKGTTHTGNVDRAEARASDKRTFKCGETARTRVKNE